LKLVRDTASAFAWKHARNGPRRDRSFCLIATATPRELSPIARARRAYAPDATAPAKWDFRWSSHAGVNIEFA